MSLPSVSRQIVFTGPDRIETAERSLSAPTGDDLVIQVRAVGVCATDLHLLAGEIGDPFPLVPGHEFVGEVAAVGPESQHGVVIGDHVAVEMLLPCARCSRCREGRYNLCDGDDMSRGLSRGRQYGVNIPQTEAPGLWGGYAEHLYVPAEAIVHRLPRELPWHRAVLVEPLAVAQRAVSRGRVGAGDRVAVIGPGPVGILAAAAARESGAASVVMLGTRPERLEMATRFGADEGVSIRSSDDPARDATAALGAPADVVIEVAGVPDAQQLAVTLVRRGGRVVLAGACGDNASVTFLADEQLLTREIDLLPSFLSAGGFEPAIASLTRNGYPFDDLVTHVFAPDKVEEAFALIRARGDGIMKAALAPDPSDLAL